MRYPFVTLPPAKWLGIFTFIVLAFVGSHIEGDKIRVDKAETEKLRKEIEELTVAYNSKVI